MWAVRGHCPHFVGSAPHCPQVYLSSYAIVQFRASQREKSQRAFASFCRNLVSIDNIEKSPCTYFIHMYMYKFSRPSPSENDCICDAIEPTMKRRLKILQKIQIWSIAYTSRSCFRAVPAGIGTPITWNFFGSKTRRRGMTINVELMWISSFCLCSCQFYCRLLRFFCAVVLDILFSAGHLLFSFNFLNKNILIFYWICSYQNKMIF